MFNEAGRILREEPFSAFVRTVGKMNIGSAELFTPLGDLYQFFLMDCAGHMLVAAEADAQGEIRSDSSPGRNQEVAEKAETVFQRATVKVIALVGAR